MTTAPRLIDLASTPFAGVLREAADERSTGVLEVRVANTVKTVYLDAGRVVFAASSLQEDRLGETLLEKGKIREGDLKKARKLIRESEGRRRMGEALVAVGAIDAEDLGSSIAFQVGRIVLSMFRIEDGVAGLEERSSPVSPDFMVSVSIRRLLYVGIRQMRSPELVSAGLGDLRRDVVLAPVPPFRFVLYKCPPGELRILEECRAPVPLRSLVSTASGISPARSKAVYALLASGVIKDASDGWRESTQTQDHESGTFLVMPKREDNRPSQAEARQEVEQELSRTAHLNWEAWSRLVTPQEALAILDRRIERYCELLEVATADAELRRDVEVLLGRMTACERRIRSVYKNL